MSKNWMMLTGLLFLGPAGTSQAHPLDPPDIVYIDGLPCNSMCQSYMAWSWHQASTMVPQPAPAQPTRRSYTEARRATATHRENSKPAAHVRTAKQAMPLQPARTAALQPETNAAVPSEQAPASIAAPPPASGLAATSNIRTVQEQVAAATALAERLTSASAATPPQQEASNAEPAGHIDSSDIKPAESAPTDNTDNLVVLLITRPEIKSVSDLAGKDVAIEDRQSTSGASIRTAIVATGATEVQLSEAQAKPIDRLVGGEVPAAVLTLVSPEAAEWFPDVPGFRIFRVPLSPRH